MIRRIIHSLLGGVRLGHALIAFTLVFPLLSLAEPTEIDFRDQTIWVEGLSGEPIWIGDQASSEAQIVLVFSNANASVTKSIKASQPFTARVLAVGGGGAGGTIRDRNLSSHPGGGGGGAGELVDREVMFTGGTKYSITIGQGGQPQGDSTNASAGGNGGDSVIFFGDQELLRVFGGGGGGGESEGLAGGSGGGSGSNDAASGGGAKANNSDGKVNVGGNSANRHAAGGGGAGSPGDDGTTGTTSGSAGSGGAGVKSDINPENVRYYAAGGGGGTTNTGVVGAGGNGGGGKGAEYKSGGAAATPGDNGTGSGGGGGGRYSPIGAAGGSGIVIIRITDIQKPIAWQGIEITSLDGQRKGKIYVDENANYNLIDNGAGGNDLLITYFEKSGALSLVTPEGEPTNTIWAQARVLAIGGGGGGGLIKTLSSTGGAGAGGGAGGMVEASGIVLNTNGIYQITVGRGGVGATTNNTAGEDGESSSFQQNGINIVPAALGGGGGGAGSAGNDGASGGGGSMNSNVESAGGAGTQGYKGGAGSAPNRGAGGGGAGGPGQDAVAGVMAGGDGGFAKMSDITGEEVWYAGGGGGAYINPNNDTSDKYLGGLGGGTNDVSRVGGGGNGAGCDGGATGRGLNPVPAANGLDGFGGGGGGGVGVSGVEGTGGKGGNGVVIIRLSGLVVGAIEEPPIPDDLVYNGEKQSAIASPEAWTYRDYLSGTYEATDAGTYTYQITLPTDSPYVFADGTREKSVTWTIKPMPVEVPEVLEKFAMDNPAPQPFENKDFLAVAVFTNGTNTCGVDDDGYYWDEATTGKHNPVRYSKLENYQQLNAGVYVITATLDNVAATLDRPAITNFIWRDGGGIEPREVKWQIAMAENEVIRFTIADIHEDRGTVTPRCDLKWKNDTDKIVYTYYKGEERPADTNAYDLVEAPTEAGVYWAHAYACKDSEHEPGNWKEVHGYTSFVIWRHPAKALTDFVDITVNSAASSLIDFPVLVRISEPVRDASGKIVSGIPGFSYARAGMSGNELRFVQRIDSYTKTDYDDNDEILPYEVETWNPSGESRVWVKINSSAFISAHPGAVKGKFRMYWHCDPKYELPASKPSTEVWSAYTGVWHLNEEIMPIDASSTYSIDATGHGLNLIPKEGGNPNNETHDGRLEQMISVPGVLGNGRQIASTPQENGNYLEVPQNYELGSTFVFEAWLKVDKYEKVNNNCFPQIACRKPTASSGDGWHAELNGNNSFQNVLVRGSGGNGQVDCNLGKDWPGSGYNHVAFVFTGGNNAAIYLNGVQKASGSNLSAAPSNSNELPLAIGNGMFGEPTQFHYPALEGSFDEIRLYALPNSYASWVTASYNMVNNPNFCTFGAVNMPDEESPEERVWVNYWATEPSLKRYWNKGELTQSKITATKGAFKFGGTVAYIGRVMPSTALWDGNGLTPPTNTLGPNTVEYFMSPVEIVGGDYPGTHILFDGTRIFDVEIIESNTQPIGPQGPTASGRVLLANDDLTTLDEGGFAVTNQSYFEAAWYHHNTDVAPTNGFNLLRGYNHEYTNATTRLWKLRDVYIGNLLSTNHEATATAILPDDYLTLPYSANSKNISSAEAYTNNFQWWETGHLVMRNAIDAQIVSSLYTNGIGTVYFDVVNAYGGTDVNAADNYLVVEYADNKNDDNDDGTEWTAVPLLVLDMKPTSIATNVNASGEKVLTCLGKKRTEAISNPQLGKYFYRVIANIGRCEPTRFRIRRESSRGSDADIPADNPKGWILLDNIIASFPPPIPSIKSVGTYDATRKGASVLGVEGAFSKQYPVAGDSFYAYGQIDGDINNVTSARFRYRWRYLDADSEPHIYPGRENWSVAYFNVTNQTFATLEPLKFRQSYGDIEFFLDLTGHAAYYKYIDYTGIGYTETQLKKIPSEDPSKYSEARSPMTDYPSHGRDWFVRLREFPNPTRGYTLYTKTGELDEDKQEIITTNALELVGTNTWRVCVRTEKPVEKLFFALESDRPASAIVGNAEIVTNCWQMSDSTAVEVPFTFNYTQSSTRTWASVPCDAKTNYLLFTVDEKKTEFSVYRADFQDFNRWTTAVNTNGLFVGSAIDSNTVSHATKEYNPEWEEWKATPKTIGNWHEDFTVTSGQRADQTYPRNRPFSNERSDHNWTAQNGMWTYGKWAHASDNTFGDDSAVQLEGRGKGALMYTVAEDIPDGLDTISYVARVAQYNEFRDFAFYDGVDVENDPASPSKYRITFARSWMKGSLVTMAALTEYGDGAYDGDGSVSLVAAYNQNSGCYEARFSRAGNDTDVKVELYRWSVVGGEMQCELLGSKVFSGDSNADSLVSNVPTSLTGLYISFEPCVNGAKSGTLVYAGVAEKPVLVSTPLTSLDNQSFDSIVYHDTSIKRLTQGSFGMLARNCPGVFVKPAINTMAVSRQGSLPNSDAIDRHTSSRVTFPGLTSAKFIKSESTFADDWILPPGRTIPLDTSIHRGCWGFQNETNITQKIIVQLSNHGENRWVDAVTNTVAGFCDQTFDIPVRSTTKCDVRLQVAGAPDDPRKDVVINEVKMSQWTGQWTPEYDKGGDSRYLENKFVYTSGWLIDDPATTHRRVLRLQPARAPQVGDGDSRHLAPISLRTPLLRGLGLFHFRWRNADPDCRILVQVCTNAVEYSRGGMTTIRNLTDAEADNANWRTIQTLDMAIAGETGSHTVYFNQRYNGRILADGDTWIDYYYGVIRIIIDKDVETKAREVARVDPEYGMIEITDAFAWDLPEYSPKDWSGWNFRAAGWNGTDPDSFANLTDGTRGLSGLLNNTLDAATLAQRPAEYYRDRMPSVQSPSFTTNNVGEVSFRARLYSPGDMASVGHGAIVAIYGATELDAAGEPKPSSWSKAGEVVVTNTIYSLYTYRLKSSSGYKALRLAIEGVKGVTEGTPSETPPIRVALDDIVICERLPLSVSFKRDRVRPFRSATYLKLKTEVPDIDSRDEQPLAEEAFGFQGEVIVDNPEEILVDDEHPITVDLWYYPGDDVWGFENWSNRAEAVHVEIPAATDKPLVFRSNTDLADSLCPPQMLEGGAGYKVVQYQLVANFYEAESLERLTHAITPSEWAPPSWNTGFADPNQGINAKFSPYTVLETIAPKRAWINEVNYCEPTRTASQASQWVELAVPSGVDMSGWKLNLYNSNGEKLTTLTTIGRMGTPASKSYSGSSPQGLLSHYAFFVIKSPYTVLNKGEYDTTWPSFNETGVLNYTDVYGFELVRPSGIVEHRAVVQGWNMYKEQGFYFADSYDGDKVTEKLNAKLAPTAEQWVWAEEDRHADGTANCSVNVTNEQGLVHANWSSPLMATPGDINTNQYIDPNWFTTPNGGYVWIYSTVLGEHLRQLVDDKPTESSRITLQQGLTTNLTYRVDRWYRLADLTATGTEGRTNLTYEVNADGTRLYTLRLASVSNRIDITARADASEEVLEKMGTAHPEYKPAILKWLKDGVTRDVNGVEHPFAGDKLKPGYYRGVDGSCNCELNLTDLYWLDLDPTDGNWEIWGGMGVKPGWPGIPGRSKSSWSVLRERRNAEGEVVRVHTNVQSVVWFMITNKVSNTAYAPFCLQGKGGERSNDNDFHSVWTSETFKVTAALKYGEVRNMYYPLRYFVFDNNSFGGEMASQLSPFGALIEITDPFSRESPASEWGWRPYSENGVETSWKLDTELTPSGVETLRPRSELSF